MSYKPSAKTEVRRNRYKVSVDADEGRRRREDNMVEIRKNKREENLQKKRREGFTPSMASQLGQDFSSSLPTEKRVRSSCSTSNCFFFVSLSISDLRLTQMIKIGDFGFRLSTSLDFSR